MRLLHTSDWHLGRQFHGASLLDEQAAAVERIVELTREQQADVVVIAGDLYDRAIPSGPAVELLDDALVRLRDTGAIVVAISGNHDSSSRAGFGDRLLSRAGVTVRADVRRFAEPVVVAPGRDGDGANDLLAVYPVPYLDPLVFDAAHPPAQADDDGPPADRGGRSTHQQVLSRAMTVVRADRARRGLPSVVVAHAFVANTAPLLEEAPVETCESERRLAVGGTDRVDQSVFAGFDYVALGHLHGHQAWDGGRVAYSGSPLRYSFSEEHHRKGIQLIDLGVGGRRTVEFVELGVGRPLCTVTGPLDRLLGDPSLAHAEAARVRAVLTDPQLPHQAMARLRARFPHTAELVHRPPERSGALPIRNGSDVRRRQPLDLALQFVAEQWDARPDDRSETLLRDAVVGVLGAER